MSGAVLKEGWGTKMGGFWKTWKRRWFVLTDGVLEYSTQPGVIPRGTINILESIDIRPSKDCKKQPAFEIVCPHRTYYVVLDKESDIAEWVEVLNNVRQNKVPEKTNKSPSDYQILRYIKHGLHSTVLEVKDTTNNNLYVAKRYPIELANNQQELIEKYRNSLLGKRIPYINPLVDIVQDDECIMFICEYAATNLQNIIRKNYIGQLIADNLFGELLAGLKNLHEMGIIIGDFHISNVLIDYRGHISLSFPGLIFPTNPNIERYVPYLSPEYINSNPPTPRSDFWAAAVILFQLYTGYVPFVSTDIESLKQEIENEIYLPNVIPLDKQQKLQRVLDPKSDETVFNESPGQLSNPDAPTILVEHIPKEVNAKRVLDPQDSNTILITFAKGSALVEGL